MNSLDWINQRRELLDAATEGPWRPEPHLEFDADGSYELARVLAKDSVDPEHYVIGVVHTGILPGDAALIADARTSLPRALDALEAVLREASALEAMADEGLLANDLSEAMARLAARGIRHAIESVIRGES